MAISTCAGSLLLLPFAAARADDAASWHVGAVLAFAHLVLLGSSVGLVLQLWLMRRLRSTTMTLAQVVIPGPGTIHRALGETITPSPGARSPAAARVPSQRPSRRPPTRNFAEEQAI